MKTIYLAQQENTDLYKIGYTKKTPEQRISELQTGNANKILLVESYASPDVSMRFEAAVHARFRLKHVSGEWFRLDEDDVKLFYSVCEQISHAFNVLSTNTYVRKDKLFDR